jgi:glutathione-regulated potassium-efflux system ancillary protein KefC
MEHGTSFLVQASVYLVSAVIAVVIAHRLGLGSVAGYLLAGIVIGPWGIGFVQKVEDVRHFAELGVVFLLFVIGLELEPRRLWNMRMRLVTVGMSQVVGSIGVIVAVALAFGIDVRVGLVAGMALALSSTALALQPLIDRGGLSTQGGQATFAVLLMQDLAVIPMLTVIPLLGAVQSDGGFSWKSLGIAVGVIAATLVGGHYVARPVFRHIARTRLRELFTAFALLLVLGIAWGFESAGLSMALGAFLAGMLLAESEYRHEIEAVIEPFKGLLLGLFFISVGMSVDFGFLLAKPLVVLALIAGMLLLKGLVLWAIGVAVGLPRGERPLFILLLAQGGEFAFVLLGLAAAREAIDAEVAQAVTLAVAMSMLLTPFLLLAYDKFVAPHLGSGEERPPADAPEAGKVIVAGLGRVGQVVARLLNASGYAPTVLDDDPDHVEASRKFGFRVYYGDATRLDLLEAAGAASADFLILALDDRDATTRLATLAKKHFPNLRLIARARDMRHQFELRDLGVEVIERETFRSAIALGEAALSAVSGNPDRAARAARAFDEHDGEVLAKLYEVHKQSPDAHVSVSNELRDQLAQTLSEDHSKIVREKPGG